MTTTITVGEQAEIDRANASGAQPVVFVHGLWLLPNSWDRWRSHFEEQGFVTLAPGWPDDPATVNEARRNPSVFAGKSVGEITDHYAEVIAALDRKPIVIGHSFGGLITQKLAGMGLASSAVAIDPAPHRGVLPLPLSALRAAFPVLGNPLNYRRAKALTRKQFRFAFANAVSEDEANRLYDEYSVAGSAKPLFQAATANFNPASQTKVNTKNPQRGPLLIISGEKDNTVPWAIANASYKRQKKNPNVTEIAEIPGRGHSLVIDNGWREVANAALAFVANKPARDDDPSATRKA
jgi:pimeloyl-ACP methyl ester carboxylesterase